MQRRDHGENALSLIGCDASDLVGGACPSDVLDDEHERASIIVGIGVVGAWHADRQVGCHLAIEVHFTEIEPHRLTEESVLRRRRLTLCDHGRRPTAGAVVVQV